MKSPLIALVLAAAVALPVFAQTQAPADAPRPDRRQQMSERMCRDMDARIAARLAWTEAKVKPTEAQRAAWDAFARESRAAAAPMQQLCTAAAPPPAANDLAARLAEREKRMSAMLDSTRQMRAAVEKLQPVLTDEQKAALAESMSEGRRGEGRHGGRGHHGGMHHGGRG